MSDTPNVLAFLQTIQQAYSLHYGDNLPDLAYLGMADFVLKEGRAFTPRTWAEANSEGRYEQGELKECFRNTLELVLKHDELIYVEGYALGVVLPVHHAWAVDDEGRVIDPTWRDSMINGPREYFGIPFARDFALKKMLKSRTYGVIDEFEVHLYKTPLPEEAKHPLGKEEA